MIVLVGLSLSTAVCQESERSSLIQPAEEPPSRILQGQVLHLPPGTNGYALATSTEAIYQVPLAEDGTFRIEALENDTTYQLQTIVPGFKTETLIDGFLQPSSLPDENAASPALIIADLEALAPAEGFTAIKATQPGDIIFFRARRLLGPDEERFFHYWEESQGAGVAYSSFVAAPPAPIEGLTLTETARPTYGQTAAEALLARHFSAYLEHDILPWTQEHAYRLLATYRRLLPSHAPDGNAESTLPIIVWHLAGPPIVADVEPFTNRSTEAILHVRLSTAAFASEADRIASTPEPRRRFFSLRLFQALGRALNFGEPARIPPAELLEERFGLVLTAANVPLTALPLEVDRSPERWQNFAAEETLTLLGWLGSMPEGLANPPPQDLSSPGWSSSWGLTYLLRRKTGDDHPLYPQDGMIAWPGSGYLTLNDNAFTAEATPQPSRVFLHQLGHFLWWQRLSTEHRLAWLTLSGWYPQQATTSIACDSWDGRYSDAQRAVLTSLVDRSKAQRAAAALADPAKHSHRHAVPVASEPANPNWQACGSASDGAPDSTSWLRDLVELYTPDPPADPSDLPIEQNAWSPEGEFAEALAYYLIDPNALRTQKPPHHDFIERVIMQTQRTEKQSAGVYALEPLRLFPHYVYAGKVRRIEVEARGAAAADKIITLRLALHTTHTNDSSPTECALEGELPSDCFPGAVGVTGKLHSPCSTDPQNVLFEPSCGSSHCTELKTRPFVIPTTHCPGWWSLRQLQVLQNPNAPLSTPQTPEANDFGWRMYLSPPEATIQ